MPGAGYGVHLPANATHARRHAHKIVQCRVMPHRSSPLLSAPQKHIPLHDRRALDLQAQCNKVACVCNYERMHTHTQTHNLTTHASTEMNSQWGIGATAECQAWRVTSHMQVELECAHSSRTHRHIHERTQPQPQHVTAWTAASQTMQDFCRSCQNCACNPCCPTPERTAWTPRVRMSRCSLSIEPC